jgi:hypothetical protein
MGASRQVRAEPHGQFTRIDVFIARCCLNRHVDAIAAANTPESYRYWFWHGGNELKQVFKNRPPWTASSGLK